MAPSLRALALLLTTTFAFASSGVLASAGLAYAPPADRVGARTAYAPPVGHPADVGATAAGGGFIFWGFYTWDANSSKWGFMQVGANDPKLPQDKDVYGFRWAVVVKEPRLPRADGDFDAICAGKSADTGEKRIAFVLDYGAEYDAQEGETPPEPRGVCALVNDAFTVQQALQTVAEVRTNDSGLICAIDSYPSKGCGGVAPKGTEENPPDEKVALALPGENETATPGNGTQPGGASAEPDGTTTDEAVDDSSSTGTWTIALAVAAILALAVGGLVVSRRRG